MDILKWISIFLFLLGKWGVSPGAGLLRCFIRLGLLGPCGSEVAFGPHAGKRHPDLMMASPEKVKENWRCLLGSSLAVLSGSFHSLPLIAACSRGQAWQTQVSPRPGGNSVLIPLLPVAVRFETVGEVAKILSLPWSIWPRGFGDATTDISTIEVSEAAETMRWSIGRRWANRKCGIRSWWWVTAGSCHLHMRTGESQNHPPTLLVFLRCCWCPTQPLPKKKTCEGEGISPSVLRVLKPGLEGAQLDVFGFIFTIISLFWFGCSLCHCGSWDQLLCRQPRDSAACVGKDFCVSAGGKRRRKSDWEKGKQIKV